MLHVLFQLANQWWNTIVPNSDRLPLRILLIKSEKSVKRRKYEHQFAQEVVIRKKPKNLETKKSLKIAVTTSAVTKPLCTNSSEYKTSIDLLMWWKLFDQWRFARRAEKEITRRINRHTAYNLGERRAEARCFSHSHGLPVHR